MSQKSKLGIWMDHAVAHVMEFTIDPIVTKVIQSGFTREQKENSQGRSENLMHNKERHQQSEFYKKLGEIIIHAEEVILFGPTKAKTELFNLLSKDNHFEKIKIIVRESDKMTENQQHAFVRDYFS